MAVGVDLQLACSRTEDKVVAMTSSSHVTVNFFYNFDDLH